MVLMKGWDFRDDPVEFLKFFPHIYGFSQMHNTVYVLPKIEINITINSTNFNFSIVIFQEF